MNVPERDLAIETRIRVAENRAVSVYLGQTATVPVRRAMAAEAIRVLKDQIKSGLWADYGYTDPSLFDGLRCEVIVQTKSPQIFFSWDFKATPLQYLCTWSAGDQCIESES